MYAYRCDRLLTKPRVSTAICTPRRDGSDDVTRVISIAATAGTTRRINCIGLTADLGVGSIGGWAIQETLTKLVTAVRA